jgi:hypothetical protein
VKPALLAIRFSRPVDDSGREADRRAEHDDRDDADPEAPDGDEHEEGEDDDQPVGLPVRERSVARDEDREPGDHPDDADRDAGERSRKRTGRADPVDDRRSADDEDEGGAERAERRDRRSQEALGEAALDVVAGEEADERVDHDQRPRRRLTEQRTNAGLATLSPRIIIH